MGSQASKIEEYYPTYRLSQSLEAFQIIKPDLECGLAFKYAAYGFVPYCSTYMICPNCKYKATYTSNISKLHSYFTCSYIHTFGSYIKSKTIIPYSCQMVSYAARLNSFRTHFPGLQECKAVSLAKAGYYAPEHSEDGLVTCFCCGHDLLLKSLTQSPFKAHVEMSVQCIAVVLNNLENICELPFKVTALELSSNEPKPAKPLCVICIEKTPTVVLAPCLHCVLCTVCAQKTLSCPVCRTEIKCCIKIYCA